MDTSLRSIQEPNVSVILPIYNAERYLSFAVESVLSQTLRDFELLALDDGSTDKSLEILRKLSTKDSRIRILQRENRGLVTTLNELINNSRGRYLARMDADDICHPERFERQCTYLDAHPKCVAVGSAVLFIDPEGSPLCPFPCKTSHEDIDNSLLSGVSEIWHPSAMLRKSAVQEINGYNGQYRHAEDVDFFLRLAEVGVLANLPDVLLEYRQHTASIGYSFRKEQLIAALEAVEMAKVRRGITAPPQPSNLNSTQQFYANAHRKWAWWALSGGNIRVARKHAFKAIKMQPLNVDNFQLIACILRGY